MTQNYSAYQRNTNVVISYKLMCANDFCWDQIQIHSSVSGKYKSSRFLRENAVANIHRQTNLPLGYSLISIYLHFTIGWLSSNNRILPEIPQLESLGWLPIWFVTI